MTANGALHRRPSQGVPGAGGARAQRGSVAMVSAGEGEGGGMGKGMGREWRWDRHGVGDSSVVVLSRCPTSRDWRGIAQPQSSKQDLATLKMCAQAARASERPREQVLPDGCPSKGSAILYVGSSVIKGRGPCGRRQLCALQRDRSVGTAQPSGLPPRSRETSFRSARQNATAIALGSGMCECRF